MTEAKHLQIEYKNKDVRIYPEQQAFTHVRLAELHIYNKYKNITENTELFYEVGSSITLVPGCYNLDSINLLLQSVLHKIIISPNGFNYLFYEFTDLTTWQAEDKSGAIIKNVENESVLNTLIYEGKFPAQYLIL